MFFILSKTAVVFCCAIQFFASSGARRPGAAAHALARAGRGLLTTACCCFCSSASCRLARCSTMYWRAAFRAWDPARGAPDGIVVLGGAITRCSRAHAASRSLSGTVERIIAIATLARAYPKARIVYSGGDASLLGDPAEANYVYPLLDIFGVRAQPCMLEPRSRNTFENALFTRRWSSRNRASVGCWSPRPSTCRAPSAASAASAFRSRPIRWTGTRFRAGNSGFPTHSRADSGSPTWRPRMAGARDLSAHRAHRQTVARPAARLKCRRQPLCAC